MHIYENKLQTVPLGLAYYSDWFMRLISHYIMVINKKNNMLQNQQITLANCFSWEMFESNG